jgi:hypothetical protein
MQRRVISEHDDIERVQGHLSSFWIGRDEPWHVGTLCYKPDTANHRRLPVRSLQESANRKRLAVRPGLRLLRGLGQMLTAKVGCEFLPPLR